MSVEQTDATAEVTNLDSTSIQSIDRASQVLELF
ncbi:MAG: hypothetical protein JWR01_22, partial [Subtercola sp.]|nr:hypothetical protein [Subtercola sp.]